MNKTIKRAKVYRLHSRASSCLLLFGLCAAVPSARAGTGGLFFDGVNDYITLGAATNINNVGVSNFTIECWFKRQGAGRRASTGSGGVFALPLVTKGMAEADDSNLDCNWFFGIGTNNSGATVLAADFEDFDRGLNHPVRGNTVVDSNVWVHGAVTYSVAGSNWVLYVNGVPDTNVIITGAAGGPITNLDMLLPRYDSRQHGALGSSLLSTGVTNSSSGFFGGVMDEVRIWNTNRTAQEIFDNFKLPITDAPNLIARWGLDQTSGRFASNSVSGGVTGTLTNFPTSPTWTNGHVSLLTVSLTSPANGGTVIGDWVDLAATASPGTAATVTNVAFYVDAVKMGEDATAPYALNWCDVIPGTYSLTAIAMDDSGTMATSSVVSVTVSTPAAAGSLEFDGVDDYVTLGAAPDLGLSAFTIECWFKRKGGGRGTTTGTGGITDAIPLVTKGRGESENSNVDMNWFLGIATNANVIAADFEEGAAGSSPGLNHPVRGNTLLINDVWYHAAATYDGANWTLYLNGNVETNVAVNQPPRSDSIQHAALASALRSTGASEGNFQGLMDEVRVWNYARSDTQIAANYNLQITNQTGLVARWALNEGAGFVARNASCGGVNGDLINGPIWSTDRFGAPSVSITNPVNNAILSGKTIAIEATASDANGSVTNVQFFNGDTLLGDDATAPYSLVWTGVTAGAYELKAVATDGDGNSTTSAVVNVTMTLVAPSVSITNPVNNDAISGTTVTVEATASDTDGSVTNVQFYSGNTLLGGDATAAYSFDWTGVYPGAYELKAVATDDDGLSTTSAVVNVVVTPPAGVGGLYFDGQNDFVTFGEAPALGVTNFTIECWFKMQGAGKLGYTGTGGIRALPLVTKGMAETEVATTNMNYFFGIGTNNLGEPVLAADFEDMNTGLNHPIRGESSIDSNTWLHAAVTYDVASSNWVLYLNGALYASTNVTGVNNSAITNVNQLFPRFDSVQHATLGSCQRAGGTTNADTGFFAGTMDEVRIWNYARSAAEIDCNHHIRITNAPGLIARWALDDAAGLIATNSGTSAVDGTLTNGPVWVDGYAFPDAPTITVPPASTNANCGDSVAFNVTATGSGTLTYQWYFGASPLLGETGDQLSLTNVNAANAGNYTVVVANLASCGVTSAPAVLTVTDTVPPAIITCATNTTINADALCQAIIPDLTSQVVASDACGAVTVSQLPLAGTIVGSGNHVVTLTVTDSANNQTNCSATVFVVDVTAPNITTCATNMTINADTNCQATIPDLTAQVVASDACGAVNITQSPVVGAVVGIGVYPVVLTVSDAANNQATCNATVSIVDVTAPIITVCATNMTINADTNCQATIPDLTAQIVASDTCGSVSVSQSPLAGSSAILGNNLITLTVTDAANNQATCNATVTVVDVTAPSIMVCATNMTINADTNCQATIPDLTPQIVASDTCGSVTTTQSPLAGTLVGLGDTVVTLTVSDAANNQATCQATISVVDANIPNITTQPQNLTNLVGTTATFTVTATSCSAMGYQWMFGTNVLSGENTATLSITNVQMSHGGDYTVILTNAAGSRTSDVASLTVLLPVAPVLSDGPMLLPNGHFRAVYTGTPNVPYTIKYADEVIGPWQTLTNITSDVNGLIELDDIPAAAPAMRFYRVVYP